MSGGNVLAGGLAGDCVRGPIRGTDGDKVGPAGKKTQKALNKQTQTRTIHRKEKS